LQTFQTAVAPDSADHDMAADQSVARRFRWLAEIIIY